MVNQEVHKVESLVSAISETQLTTPQKEDNLLNNVADNSRKIEALVPQNVSTPSKINWSFLIVFSMISIWFVVAFILFVHKVSIYDRFNRYIKRESTEVSDMEYLELLGNTVEKMKIKRTVGLYRNRYISSPLLVGFFKVSIVLPTMELSKTDYYYTLLHELTHYKRRDMFYKWLVQFTICFHWFNPLVHLMGREINHACELSCDEAVIKDLNYEKMRTYGDTLLNAAEAGKNCPNFFATVALFENKKLLKERLYCIMNYKKKSKSMILMMILLTLLMCVGSVGLGSYHFGTSTETL